MRSNDGGYPGSVRRCARRLSSPLRALLVGLAIMALLIASYFLSSSFLHHDPILPKTTPNMQFSAIAEENLSLPAPTIEPIASSIPSPVVSAAKSRYQILVNGDHPLPGDYDTSAFVLLNGLSTTLFTVKEPDTYADPAATDALTRMLEAARLDGLSVWQISEGYRSIATQQKIWDEKYEKYREENGLSEKKALEAVSRRVAKPGCSEHHTGLSFDLTVPGESFRKTPQAAWLAQHCHEYGFIIRYTAEKERITGITEEPWHIRYVGEEAAMIMTQENLCLEEYIQKYQP